MIPYRVICRNRGNNAGYNKINICSMSDIDNRNELIIVDSDNYLLRNCICVWGTYNCKEFSNGERLFGISFFENTDMNQDIFYTWITNLDTIFGSKDHYKIMYSLKKGSDRHTSRIESFLNLESSVSKKVANYLLFSFKVTGTTETLRAENIAMFTKRYSSYRLVNKTISPHDVGYCWCINEINGNVEFYFNVFCYMHGDYIDTTISKIIDTIRRWIFNYNPGLEKDNVVTPILKESDIVPTYSVQKRNDTIYKLSVMSITDNEDRDMNTGNVRAFATSHVN